MKAKDDETKTENGDETAVKPEAVPKDTAAELERVKQLIGANFGIDMRSPGQVAQADKDAEDAQAELEKQQAKEAKEAELAAVVEEEPATTSSSKK
jgi:hypothetical protein